MKKYKLQIDENFFQFFIQGKNDSKIQILGLLESRIIDYENIINMTNIIKKRNSTAKALLTLNR